MTSGTVTSTCGRCGSRLTITGPGANADDLHRFEDDHIAPDHGAELAVLETR